MTLAEMFQTVRDRHGEGSVPKGLHWAITGSGWWNDNNVCYFTDDEAEALLGWHWENFLIEQNLRPCWDRYRLEVGWGHDDNAPRRYPASTRIEALHAAVMSLPAKGPA